MNVNKVSEKKKPPNSLFDNLVRKLPPFFQNWLLKQKERNSSKDLYSKLLCPLVFKPFLFFSDQNVLQCFPVLVRNLFFLCVSFLGISLLMGRTVFLRITTSFLFKQSRSIQLISNISDTST